MHLNSEETLRKKILLETAKEHSGLSRRQVTVPGVLFKAHIDALECAVVVPKIPNYPSDVLEVIAPVCLREQTKVGGRQFGSCFR